MAHKNPPTLRFKSCDCGGRLLCIDSRSVESGEYVRRRYRCAICQERITTIEVKVDQDSNFERSRAKEFVNRHGDRRFTAALNRISEAVMQALKREKP